MTNAAPTSLSVTPYAQGRMVPIDLSASGHAASYNIMIGDNILSEAGSLISAQVGGARRCLIVTDSNIAPLYLKRLEAILGAAGHTLLPSQIIEAGEASKDFTHLQNLLDRMLAAGLDRKCLVIAFGGGVIGDLAGLAAALVLRGVDMVQIPTSLLAQVDSSVGGKTGINTGIGKNTVGTFSQPRLVIADVALLDSLPRGEVLAGYAEVVKYGLIRDAAFYDWCRAHYGELIHSDRAAQIYAVGVSCAHKAAIVAADEREAGERALLNFGHTFGHALEAVLGYGTLLHGEAVAIGMAMAFKLSAQLGLCSHAEAYDVRDHLAAAGLPVVPPQRPDRSAYDIDQLMGYMAADKKAENKKLTLILVRGIGKAFVSREAPEQEVRDVWRDFLSGAKG